MPRCSFRKLKGSLGFHFGSFRRLLGCILGALGMPRPPFFHFWVSPGQHFGSLGNLWAIFWPNWWPLGRLGDPNAPPAAQNRIFLNFSLPFWRHFGSILELKIDEKINEKIDANLIRFLMHFGLDFGGILSYFSMKCWWLPAMFRPYESISPASKIEGRGLNWGMILATKMHKKSLKKTD